MFQNHGKSQRKRDKRHFLRDSQIRLTTHTRQVHRFRPCDTEDHSHRAPPPNESGYRQSPMPNNSETWRTANKLTRRNPSAVFGHGATPDPLTRATEWVKQLHQQQPTSVVATIVEKHDKVFQGIGKHKYRQVELEIDRTVPPKVQVQRRIPFPKRRKFDAIIQELENADIIEAVEGPTEWVSNVVLTLKADPTELRMNIDMTTANTAIKRTRHVIPTIEELRYKLNGAKHFTKLDMKQGYMQLELKLESRNMTTFYTHRGLRRFKRLNFGTNSAAELFHQEISQTLVDIDNADNLYDDILVHGKTQLEHDIALAQVLQRLEDCGLTLGRKKCKFDQAEIEFFGMKFTAAGMAPTQDRVTALFEAPAPTTVSEVRSFQTTVPLS